jgi:hypothetical protein
MKNFKQYLVIALILMLFNNYIIGGEGESGMAFLKMPSSARLAGAMGVFDQVSATPHSLFENPIGIQSSAPFFAFSHNLWFADVTGDFVALSAPINGGTLASGLKIVRIPGIEVRETPSEVPLNTIEAQYLSIAVAYSYSVFSRLTIGGSVKYLHELLYTATGSGVAFDIGTRWRAPGSLYLSLLLKNIGYTEPLRDKRTELPTTFEIGIVRPEVFVESPLDVAFGIKLGYKVNTSESYAGVGAEAKVMDILYARGGYERVGTLNRYSLGFGLKIKRVQIDYAFLIMPEGLNYPHLFSLTYTPITD